MKHYQLLTSTTRFPKNVRRPFSAARRRGQCFARLESQNQPENLQVRVEVGHQADMFFDGEEGEGDFGPPPGKYERFLLMKNGKIVNCP